MSEAFGAYAAALGSGPWLTQSVRTTRDCADEAGVGALAAAMQGALIDDAAFVWELQQWAFDSTAMVRSLRTQVPRVSPDPLLKNACIAAGRAPRSPGQRGRGAGAAAAARGQRRAPGCAGGGG